MQGLTENQVQNRIQNNQVNHKLKSNSRTYKEIFYSNIFTYFNVINLILFVFVLSVKSHKNALFFIVVLSNSAVGIIQEIRAKKVLDKLEILVENQVVVIRDGTTKNISIHQLVVDDLMVCKEGMQVPSDCQLIEGQLELNESLLTGESKPQTKRKGSKVFSGTFVTAGEAVCQVTHVGKDNYSEKLILEAKKFKRHKVELKESLDKILKAVGFLLVPTGLILFYNQRQVLDLSYTDSVVKTVAAVIGMIPSGLVFLTSIALALSAIRLAKKRILVQELYCVETLARIDVLCLDKTGTITEGNLRVHQVEVLPETDDKIVYEVMSNYCRVFPRGNATSQALYSYFSPIETYAEIKVLPFSSDRKYSAIQFEGSGTYYLGAFQFLFPNDSSKISEKMVQALKEGYRVIALAKSNQPLEESKLPEDLEVAAYILMKDKVRGSSAKTINYFKNQGVRCKVISGDDPQTVARIAEEAKVEGAEQWVDASLLSDEELKEKIFDYHIFGRVTPIQKKLIVEALQSKNHVVAMVGDGVNDVPSLKKADISIALGSGSDAAKNTANIILLDSDFSCMPNVVDEGRRVINNLCNASSMFLIKTIFSITLTLLTIVLVSEYPFSPIQLTIISSFSVGIPTFFMQFEPSFQRVEGNFLKKAIARALPFALLIALSIAGFIVVQHQKNFSKEVFSTASTFQTAIIYTMALYFIYSPLTKYRVKVISLVQLSLFLILVSLGVFLGLVPLSLLMILGILGTSIIAWIIVCYWFERMK